jgi:hypothetical protein
MADPQIDLVKIRNAELARRGLGAAQGISDFAAPVRDTLYSGIANPLAYLKDMSLAGLSGIYGAASDISGFGASALGAPELGKQLFSQADESYGSAMTRLKGALPGVPDISGFGPQDMTDIFNDENLGIPAFGVQIPATKRSIMPATEREAGKVFSGGVTESGSGSLGPKVIPSDVQGGRGRDPRPQIAKDAAAAAALSPAQELFDSAFQEYISGVRGSGPDAPSPKELEDYKAEFAKATGLDVNGNADTSQALMAFGLAAMQNRAGKGFNVGRMLESLGQAGEKALPALDKARAEARNNAASAGKYALEMRSSDKEKAAAAKEKAMQRTGYYVVPKSKDVKGFLAGVSEGKGRLENLNVWELDKLQNNKDFSDKYDILPSSMWGEIVKEVIKTPEAKETHLTTPQPIQLIPGNTDDIFKIHIFHADPNKNPNGKSMVSGDGQQQYEALARMYQDNQKAKKQFVELGILNKGTNAFSYSIDKLNSFASAFGVQFGEEATETEKMIKILKQIAAKQAPRILGEAGKTISDGDRERVTEIVGDRTITSNSRILKEKFQDLFNDIIIGTEVDINQALSTLNRYTGRNIGSALQESELSDEQRSGMIDDLKALGVID